jgi:ribosomal protein S18 acetylase RimI-like enzyme
MWEPIGFDTAGLTEAVVRSFLLKDGYVAEKEHNRIVGVVCINFARPQISGDALRVPRAHRIDTTVLLEPSRTKYFSANTFAYFYSLAVAPEYVNMGVGLKILRFVESEAVEHGCSGILLETGRRTGWLIEWYESAGFRLIGNFVRGAEPIVFMLKELPPNQALLPTRVIKEIQ